MAFRHSKDSRIYIAELDVSGVASAFDLPIAGNNPDATTLLDQGRKHSNDIDESRFEAEIVWDDGYDDELEAIKSGSADGVLSAYWGGDALGRRGYAGESIIASTYTLRSSIADIVRGRLSGHFNGDARDVLSLGAKTTLTATTNGSTLDGGAASSSGAWFFWHVLAWSATGGNARWQLQFQDGAADPPGDALGAAQNITAVGAGSLLVAGSIARYVRQRLILDATSGSITIQAGIARL